MCRGLGVPEIVLTDADVRAIFGFFNEQKENARRGVEECAPENAVRVSETHELTRAGKSIKGGKTGGSQGKDQSKTEELRPHSH